MNAHLTPTEKEREKNPVIVSAVNQVNLDRFENGPGDLPDPKGQYPENYFELLEYLGA